MAAETDSLRSTAAAPHLKRTLKLRHLIVYGIIIIQPTAPMGIYGVVSNAARGHVVTTILIAMVAMLFTAVSYGRMARVYPSAGSAYHLCGQGDPSAGRICRGMVHADGLSAESDHLRDLVQRRRAEHPARHSVCRLGGGRLSSSSRRSIFCGVQSSGRVNAVLALRMGIVVVIFLAYAIRYIALVARPIGGQWLTPFYDPGNFAAVAALSRHLDRRAHLHRL